MRHLILSILIAAVSATSHAADTDSAIARADALIETAPDSAIVLCDSLLGNVRLSPRQEALTLHALGNARFAKGDMPQAIDLFRATSVKARECGDSLILAAALSDLGVGYRVSGNSDSALVMYNQALGVLEQIDAPAEEANLLTSIAVFYANQGRFDESAQFGRRAFERAKQSGDIEAIMYAGQTLGIVLYLYGNKEEGLAIEREMVTIAEDRNLPRYILKTYASIIDMHYKDGRRDSVDIYIARGQQILPQVAGNSVEALGFLEESYVVLTAYGRYRESLQLQQRILSTRDAGTFMPMDKLYMRMARNYRGLGDTERMAESYERSAAIADSLHGLEIDRQLSEFGMKYQTSQKELHITRLEAANARQQLMFYAPGETSTVIGYSDRAILDSSNLPQALTEMLASYPQITGNSSYPITTEPVEPIIKTRWHQLAPFNGSCPDYRGQATPAGCTAVAVAQILNHFRSDNFGNYLLEYKDSESGAEISIDFGKAAPYDWDNMLDDYSGGYTQPQADAVARLMFEAGAASLCEYFPGSTSGKWALVALSRYFDYEAEFLFREYLPTRYWMDRIYRELQAGRPIIYGGTGYFSQGAKAHEFIIDGCDSDGLVHINWGWGGEADGYYDVTYCKAEGTGIYDDGYCSKQLMICGLHPRTDADTPYSEGYVVTSGTSLYKNDTKYAGVVKGYTTNIYSIDNIELEWDIVRVHAETGEYLTEINTYHTGSTGIFPTWGSVHVSANIWKTVTLGKYLWKIASRRKGSDNAWTLRDIPMKPYSVYTAEGTVTEQGYDDYDGEWDQYTGKPRYALTWVEPVTEVIAGSMFFARISTRSISDYPQNSHGYSPGFSLAFTDMESGKVYVTPATISNAYDNHYLGLEYSDIKAVEIPVNPTNNFSIPAGRYRVTASDSDGTPGSDWITDADIYIDVKDKVKYPILQYSGVANYKGDYITGWLDTDTYMQTPVYRQDHAAYLRLYGSSGRWHFLTSANGVWSESTVNVYLCPVDDPSLKSEMILGTVTANMFPSQECDVPLNTNFYPFEGQYFLYLRYMTPDGERDILPQRWDHVDPATGLGRVPTNILVNAPAAGADIPRLQIWNVTAGNTSVSFDVKNIGTNSFSGAVTVTIYDLAGGTSGAVTTAPFTLEPSMSASMSVDAAITDDRDYDAYFRCLPTAARNGNNVATFATKPSGEPARYIIDLDNSGVDSVTAADDMRVTASYGSITVTGAPDGAVMAVYTLDGRAAALSADMHVSGLARGLYIVSVAGRSFKVAL